MPPLQLVSKRVTQEGNENKKKLKHYVYREGQQNILEEVILISGPATIEKPNGAARKVRVRFQELFSVS
jgi:hypothetical protein